MHIAILMTNTDESDFAAVRPKDGEKFIRLLGPLRPDWRFTVFAVKDGVFPADLAGIDGVVITGSPASVHDPLPWIAPLMDLIRRIVAQGIPLFGACFGHQAIAMALGGKVGPNPGGWVMGLVDTTFQTPGLSGPAHLYAAHVEQVTDLPPGAEVAGTTPGCPIAAYRIGSRVLTSQYHPEMTADFIADLVEHLAPHLPEGVADRARASLAGQADTRRVATAIVDFLETA